MPGKARRVTERVVSAHDLLAAHAQTGGVVVVLVFEHAGKLLVEERDCSPTNLERIAEALVDVARRKRDEHPVRH